MWKQKAQIWETVSLKGTGVILQPGDSAKGQGQMVGVHGENWPVGKLPAVVSRNTVYEITDFLGLWAAL